MSLDLYLYLCVVDIVQYCSTYVSQATVPLLNPVLPGSRNTMLKHRRCDVETTEINGECVSQFVKKLICSPNVRNAVFATI